VDRLVRVYSGITSSLFWGCYDKDRKVFNKGMTYAVTVPDFFKYTPLFLQAMFLENVVFYAYGLAKKYSAEPLVFSSRVPRDRLQNINAPADRLYAPLPLIGFSMSARIRGELLIDRLYLTDGLFMLKDISDQL